MQNRPLSMALDWKSTCKIETRTYKLDVLHFRYRERLLRKVLGSEFLKLVLLFALVDGLRRVFHTAIRSGYLFRDNGENILSVRNAKCVRTSLEPQVLCEYLFI